MQKPKQQNSNCPSGKIFCIHLVNEGWNYTLYVLKQPAEQFRKYYYFSNL